MLIYALIGLGLFLVMAASVSGVTPSRRRRAATQGERYWRVVRGLGLGMLFLFYMILPIPIRVAGGSAGFDVVFLWAFGWIGLFFWSGVCLLWSRIVEVHARKITSNRAVWSTLVLLPVVVIGAYAIHESLPSVRAACVLDNAELAALPMSASELKVSLWFTPFSGQGCLRFRATPGDIERFLATSPIFRDVEYEECSEGQERFFYPRDARHPTSVEDLQRCVSREGGAPSWRITEFTESMTGYRIDPSGSQISGAVIVDEDGNLVFVRLSFD